jgi:Metallo-peptidase family M12B Reprolysin-like
MRIARALVAAHLLSAAVQFAYAAPSSEGPVDVFGRPAAGSTPGTRGMQPVVVDFPRLAGLKPRTEVRVRLPDADYRAVVDGVHGYPAGVTEWSAHLVADGDKRVVLIGAPDGITGYVRTPVGNWKLTTIGGKNYLVADATPARPGRTSYASMPQVLMAEVAVAASAPAVRAIPAGMPPGTAAYPVRFDLVRLSDLAPGDEADLSLPNAGTYKVAYRESVANADGTTTWVGHLRDYGDDYRVVVTYGPDGTDGHILTPYGEFLLGTHDGVQWLVDVARSGLQAPPQAGADALVAPPHLVGPAGAARAAQSAGAMGAAGPVAAAGAWSNLPGTVSGVAATSAPKPSAAAAPKTATAPTNTTIDVLVLYTDGFKARLGGAATTRVSSLVALANQAYKDSGVAITLRLVGTAQVPYTDLNSDTAALNDLTSGAGAFADVRSLRNEYGADLVTVLRPLHTKARMTCGLGWIGGYGGSPISWYAGSGYSVVGDGTDMDGRGYYCNDYSFAHELGHNMGSMHDRATVASQGGGTGAYPYAFGYGKQGAFGTVMSYISPVIGKFSNPGLKTCANQACGISETDSRNAANNALSLNNTRDGVAGFYATTVAPTIVVTGVVSTAAGQPLAGAVLSGTGATCKASGANGAYTCSMAPGWSGSLSASLAGYTFAPASIAFSTIAANSPNQNFQATAVSATSGASRKK